MQSKTIEGETIMMSDAIAKSVDFTQFESDEGHDQETAKKHKQDYVVIETESGILKADLTKYSETFLNEKSILFLQIEIFDRRDLKKLFEFSISNFSIWCGATKIAVSQSKRLEIKKREVILDRSPIYVVELILER